MKLIKQLSENQFVVEMEPEDRGTRDTMTIAHDYVRFETSQGIQTDWKRFEGELYGPYKTCSNWIASRGITTLSVRQMQEILLPYLLKHNYMKPEHLLIDGKPNYTWGQEYGTVIHDCENHPSKDIIYLYRDKSYYDILPLAEYEKTYTGMMDATDNKIYVKDDIYNFKDNFSGVVMEVEGNYFVKITKCKKDESKIGKIIPFENSENYIKQG